MSQRIVKKETRRQFTHEEKATIPRRYLVDKVPSRTSVTRTRFSRRGSTVSITGPAFVGWSNYPCIWHAVITGRRDPYTFQWSGLKSGTLSSISGPIYSSGALNLEIWDALGQHATATPFFVNMDSNDPGYSLCTGGE